MRLDKFIATTTHYSRSEAKKLIKAKRVLLNQSIATNVNGAIDPTNDQVQCDHQILSLLKPRYFMLNKPSAYVCSNKDSEHPTVLDCLDETKKESLQIAGRLDSDTTGLVFITDDGQWNHKVTAPNHACFKTYHVTVKHPLKEDLVARFQKGILLNSEKKATRPAILKLLDERHAELQIQEGKYHQVKRMFAATGNRVVTLHRAAIGTVILDPQLNAGEYRPLTPTEINTFI